MSPAWRRGAAAVLCAAGAGALPPTKITASDCCSGSQCLAGNKLTFPADTYPNTPRFNFTIAASLGSGPDHVARGASPTYRGHGSLGLPTHPLGVFGFDQTGSACGPQKLYVKDGVLAVITMDFPACPWQSGEVNIPGRVDVWTTIPAVAVTPGIAVSTGFTFNFEVFPTHHNHSADVGAGSGNNTKCMKVVLKDCGNETTTKGCIDCVKGRHGDDRHKKDMKAAGCKRSDWKDYCDSLTPSPPGPPPPAPAQPHLICTKVLLAQPLGGGADPLQDHCTLDPAHPPPYPPAGADRAIPSVTIDLSADAATRWDHVVQPRAAQIQEMIDQFIAAMGSKNGGGPILHAILTLSGDVLMKKANVPTEYANEMKGISKSTGINIGEIFLYNIMYEIIGLCTSMVSQDTQGNIYHSRNLDFGIFMGTDPKTHNWALTPLLRPLLFNANYVKDGKSLYNATAYAGYVGLLTGMKLGGFSLSVDTRLDGNVDKFLLKWVMGSYDGQFLTFKTRDMMENMGSYNDALYEMSHYKPMGPAYVIMGGAKSGEGAVITLQADKKKPGAVDVRTLTAALANNSFYVLETNYDGNAPPPDFDDRRYPAQDCMNKLGAQGVSWANLWAVHSSNPTLNAITTYTTLMSAQTGHFEAYKQLCVPGPDCAPF